jgi:hypothetical protein
MSDIALPVKAITNDLVAIRRPLVVGDAAAPTDRMWLVRNTAAIYCFSLRGSLRRLPPAPLPIMAE